MAKTLSPIEAFLAPLAKLLARHPDLEGEVIWAEADGWLAQNDVEGLLDAEEVAFYAEGLLLEALVGQARQALAPAGRTHAQGGRAFDTLRP